MQYIKFIILSLLCFVALSAFAQDPANDSVKLREASFQHSVLMLKEYTELGELDAEFGTKVAFQLLMISYPGQQKTPVKGVVVTVTQANDSSGDANAAYTYATNDENDDEDQGTTVYAYIDADEVGALAHVIPQLISTAEQWDGVKAEKHVTYITRDDFGVTISHTVDNKQITGVSAYDGDSAMAFMKSPQHLLTMKGFFDKAVKLMGK